MIANVADYAASTNPVPPQSDHRAGEGSAELKRFVLPMYVLEEKTGNAFLRGPVKLHQLSERPWVEADFVGWVCGAPFPSGRAEDSLPGAGGGSSSLPRARPALRALPGERGQKHGARVLSSPTPPTTYPFLTLDLRLSTYQAGANFEYLRLVHGQ